MSGKGKQGQPAKGNEVVYLTAKISSHEQIIVAGPYKGLVAAERDERYQAQRLYNVAGFQRIPQLGYVQAFGCTPTPFFRYESGYITQNPSVVPCEPMIGENDIQPFTREMAA